MPRAKGSKNKVPKRQVERTPTQVQAHRARIQEMDLKGYTQVLIARHLDISQPLVSLELKAIRQEYHDAYVDDRRALVMRETGVLLDVRRRAYEEMEELKRKGKKKRVSASGTAGEGGWSKEEETTEDPNVGGFLSIILDTEQKIARLWGLEELPKVVFQVNNTQNNMVVGQDELLRLLLGAQSQPDPIDVKMASIEDKPKEG